MKQAYSSLSAEQRRNTCLHIHMVAATNHPQSPLLTTGFKLLSEDWSSVDPLPTDKESRSSGFFKLWIDGGVFHSGWESLVDDQYLRWKPDRYYPQWPWIYAHCSAVGDLLAGLALIRANLLLDAIEKFDDINGKLEEFIAPPTARQWDISAQSFDRWMKLMYPVTSSIRSRFHSPSDLMSQRYGHLS